MQTRFIFLVYLTLVSCSVIAVPKVIKVVDAAKENGTPQNQYFLSVLRLALDKSQPVAIPIAFGSFGIRVLVKNVADKAKLNTHLSLSELQKFKVLLGKDWSDVEIFEKSGFTVETCMDGLTCYRVLTNSTGRVFRGE
ncbi:hypothetical protein [Pseudoalteromonas sp. PS5]|uniref:hypothetical protein n=1 Tax=Pseudoalteromonas sp. PS5 TaxID=1437473 RepID=UPI001F4FAF50|nr:hypothetical protein [Pseudoalteromonas sp. PS5]